MDPCGTPQGMGAEEEGTLSVLTEADWSCPVPEYQSHA